MSEFDSAFEKIGILVQDFQRNESHYKSPAYTEAQARKDFIDKFWIALGWDVNHDRETNPYEQEVKVERGVVAGGSQRRADYAFYLAPNFHDVRFFVEAKKPFIEIGTSENYFQLIRYGWNSETPLAVLTDFEQFHILDCRWRPDLDTALNRSLVKYRYTDYVIHEKISEIYWLFSREAVSGGSLDKRAKELPRPRGKAAKLGLVPGGYQSIDESFLSELDEYRNSLARNFKNRNPYLDSETLTELAQRTLDRLVFLRFLEDKGIEPARIIERFGTKSTTWEDFIAASRKLDRIYNGVVYKHHGLLDGPDFRVDENAFANICESLAHVNSPYDFNAIPIHILGSIYERFLGKVIVATDKRAKVEEKPEVRKAGGVYYTPEYIVRYIVENTVGKLIAGKTPGEIAEMRFADIACGSGSFLLGVFDLLLNYHGHYYNDNPGKVKKGDCIARDGKLYLSLQKKRDILLNNIYGVDIDAQAVEVCQLSLYLKLLQEETESSAHQYQLDFEHEARMKRLLPDLSKNIRCGNSLIGTDILDGRLFAGDEECKLNPMNFEDAFPEVMKHGGFDAIVGNPPYRSLLLGKRQKSTEQEIIRFYEMTFTNSAEYKMNMFGFFMEKCPTLLRLGGVFAYIIPNLFFTTHHFKKLRRYLLEQGRFEIIFDLRYKVFRDAETGGNAVFVFAKDLTINQTTVLTATSEEQFSHPVSRIVSSDSALKDTDFNLLADTQFIKISERIAQLPCIALGDIAIIYQGIITGDNSNFLSDKSLGKKWKKILRGRNIERYNLKFGEVYVLFDPKRLWSNANAEMFDVPEKLISRQTSDKLVATYDSGGYFSLDSTHVIHLKQPLFSLKYLLGIYNSKLLNFLYTARVKESGRVFPQVKVVNLKPLPIRQINFSDTADKSHHDEMVVKVEAMLEAKKQLALAKTDKDKTYYENKCASLDRQIDRLVYELYGLTEEEVMIVEG